MTLRKNNDMLCKEKKNPREDYSTDQIVILWAGITSYVLFNKLNRLSHLNFWFFIATMDF